MEQILMSSLIREKASDEQNVHFGKWFDRPRGYTNVISKAEANKIINETNIHIFKIDLDCGDSKEFIEEICKNGYENTIGEIRINSKSEELLNEIDRKISDAQASGIVTIDTWIVTFHNRKLYDPDGLYDHNGRF